MANQLAFVLNQRHEELAERERENDLSYDDDGGWGGGGGSGGGWKRTRVAVQQQRGNGATEPARGARGQRRLVKRKDSFAYVSPFVKLATEKALKRAAANARLLPNRPAIQVPVQGQGVGNVSNDSIRSEDLPKKKSQRMDWNFETKTTSLFDPKLQKQEVFKRQPRIPEVRLRPSGLGSGASRVGSSSSGAGGAGFGSGTAAAANAVAEALGLTAPLAGRDDQDVEALADAAVQSAAHAVAEATAAAPPPPGSSMTAGAFAHRPPPAPAPAPFRRGPLTRPSAASSARLSGSSDWGDSSPSPPLSLSPPRHRRGSAANSYSPTNNNSSSSSRVHVGTTVTRSVSPIDEQLAQALIREDGFLGEPADSAFEFRGSLARGGASGGRGVGMGNGGGSSEAMMSSMAQVLSAVSELVQSIRAPSGGGGVLGGGGGTPWTARRRATSGFTAPAPGPIAYPATSASMLTPARAGAGAGRPPSELQLLLAEEALKDLHARELAGPRATAPSVTVIKVPQQAPATGALKAGSAQVQAQGQPQNLPLSRAAVADLLLSKLQAVELSDRDTIALLQQPPPFSSRLSSRPSSSSSSTSSSALAASAVATAASSGSGSGAGSGSIISGTRGGGSQSRWPAADTRADATRLPRHTGAAPATSFTQSRARPESLGMLRFAHDDSASALPFESEGSVRPPGFEGTGLSDADAAYFYQLATEDARSRSALQLAPPAAINTHETAITSMLHAEAASRWGAIDAAASGGEGTGTGSISSSPALRVRAFARGADSSFVKSLLTPSVSDRARIADHRQHLSHYMHQRRSKAIAHLPTLMPSVSFVQSIEAYNKRMRLAQEMKSIPFEARGISSCFVGDRIADILLTSVVDDVSEELEAFFEEYSLNFSGQI